MSAPGEVRTSVLGGEVIRRGWLSRAPRSMVSRVVGGGSIGLAALVLMSGASWESALVCAAMLVAVWWQVWPGERGLGEPRLDARLRRRRAARRRRTGQAAFLPLPDASAGGEGPLWELPVAVGRVAPLKLVAGHGLFALHHTNVGEGHYLSVLCETGGLGTGLRADDAYAQGQEGFGRLMATFAERARLISGLQQISRVVPHDSAQHRHWVAGEMVPPPEDAPAAVREGFRLLVMSYEAKVAEFADDAGQHRNYLVARFDMTPAFHKLAARRGGGPDAWAELIRGELRILRALVAEAGLGPLTVLGEQRAVAAMRALQSPGCAPERHAGLGWAEAFLPFETAVSAPPARPRSWRRPFTWLRPRPVSDHLVVDGEWRTRIAYLPQDGLVPAAVGPRWLAPVLTDRSGVVRTVSTRIDLVPARDARAAAMAAKTSDRAAAMDNEQRGRTDDGTDEALLGSSSRLLADLAPASGHAGVRWGLFITLQAPTYDDLLDACDALEDAAGRSGINRLQWCDEDQDLAWGAALPLARGIRS